MCNSINEERQYGRQDKLKCSRDVTFVEKKGWCVKTAIIQRLIKLICSECSLHDSFKWHTHIQIWSPVRVRTFLWLHSFPDCWLRTLNPLHYMLNLNCYRILILPLTLNPCPHRTSTSWENISKHFPPLSTFWRRFDLLSIEVHDHTNALTERARESTHERERTRERGRQRQREQEKDCERVKKRE